MLCLISHPVPVRNNQHAAQFLWLKLQNKFELEAESRERIFSSLLITIDGATEDFFFFRVFGS